MPALVSAYTPAETWYWTPPGGSPLALSQPGWNIATIGGSRFGLPALRGQNAEIPFRAGQQHRAKWPDSRVITLVMWIDATDNTSGLPGPDPRLTWNNKFQQLRQAFWARGVAGSVQGTLQRNWWLTQGGTSQLVAGNTLAEIAGTMEPTMQGRVGSSLSVDLLLADPYFYGATKTQTLTYNTAATVTGLGEGIVGEGYPSSVNSFTAVLHGPLANPTLTNQTAGVSFTYGQPIGGGASVTFDILAYTAVDSLAVNQIAQVTHAGSRMWSAILPGANTFKLTSTNGADTGTAVLTYNDAYI